MHSISRSERRFAPHPEPALRAACDLSPEAGRGDWLPTTERLLVGPAYRGVMAVLTGIVPAHAMIGKSAAGRADRERELVGRDRMAGGRPHFSVFPQGRQRLDRHVHDPRNFGRARLAAHLVGYRHRFD